MKVNVGSIDRMVRIVAAVVLATLIGMKILTGSTAIVAGVMAAVLLVTAFVRFCPAYRLIGVNTCSNR